MNKVLVVGGVLLALVVILFAFQGNSATYVADIHSEVDTLETELAEIEAAVEAGTMTPEDAAAAQVKIAARLEAINGAVASGQNAKLTAAQQAQLVSGLTRLKGLVTKYRTTLFAIDEAVEELPEAERPQPKRGSGGSSRSYSLVADLDATVDIVEENVEENVKDDVLDDTDMTDEEDEMMGEEDEVSEEVTEGDTVDDSDDTMTDEEMSDDTMTDEETTTDDTLDEEETSDGVSIDIDTNADFTFGDDTGATEEEPQN